MFSEIRKFTALVLVLAFLSASGTNAQSQSDFADPYDFNLRNYKDSGGREGYQEYTIPPNLKKPYLVSPKNAQVPFESPFPTTGGLRRTASPNNERTQEALVNPLTGEINVEAILQRQAQQAERKKRQNQIVEEEKYTETTFRRFTIIFFMTLPITLGIGYAIASAAKIPGIGKFQKTFGGSIFVFTFGTGLAFANAWHDMKEYESMKRENQPASPPVEPTSSDSLGFGNSFPMSAAGVSLFPGKEYKIDISVFQISF
ncbi:hypothetical protein EHQ12_11855 [Leptospira gomenensis]|uniref:Uncharacterized protein n=1 Tax=Leptospira gomenensis TaxID=2484974 RepID=A0A5F1YY65_9LEPT|nr:hypothetical protein EHQ17_11700 [Leptospira gomenensis]TGK36781.1 hypothetical protein EHQ12_11855 [Leptospira gomenensis]TGK48813.1 hypothetical protein EHQ07_05580 [Leptospira gomenensis]TGK64579.1 hypothetical protein EHQ13_06755 [Leptospira gomenensis]